MTDDNRQTGPKTTSGGFLADHRGVSELLGAVLIFALLIALLVLAQVSLVPTLNQQVEYEHSQRVADDVGDFETDLFRVAGTGAPASTSVELGVTYPNRPLLLNPAPVQGNLQTLDEGDVVLSGVTSNNDETADYWTGTVDRTYSTRTLEYAAPYNEFRNPGTIRYENGVRYRQFPNAGDRILVDSAKAPLVEGDRITLITVDGDLQENGQRAETFAVSPISAPSQSIAVRSVDASTNVTITTRTRLSTGDWEELLDGEDNVLDVDVDPATNVLTVTLAPGDYQLRMAHVGLGEGFDRAQAAYLTREAGFPSIVPTAGGGVSVEVRDRFNNPVSGVDVTFEITDGQGNLTVGDTTVPDNTTITATSDQRGLATVSVNGSDGNVQITAESDVDPSAGSPIAEFERVVFGVQIGPGDIDTDDPSPTDPSDGEEVNPNRNERLVLSGSSTDGDRVSMEFRNTIGDNVRIESIRINSYQPNGPGSSPESFPDYAVLVDDLDVVVGDPIDILGPDVSFTNQSVTVPAFGDELRLKFYVDSQLSAGGNPKPLCGGGNVNPDGDFVPSEDCFTAVQGGEHFYLTMTYSYVDDGERVYVRSTYVVAPLSA